MRILVAAKQVIDPNVQIRVAPDGVRLATEGLKMTINPFDEVAVEQAVRLKESGIADEVIVVSVGTTESEAVLRHALAMGADKALLITTPPHSDLGPEPLTVAKVLSAVVRSRDADLVLLGRQASDDDMGATGSMLAALLDWPQGTGISSLAVEGLAVAVAQEANRVTSLLRFQLPAVVTVDLRLNEPRFLSLPGRMRAKKIPIERLSAAELGVEVRPRLTLAAIVESKVERRLLKAASVEELARVIRDRLEVA